MASENSNIAPVIQGTIHPKAAEEIRSVQASQAPSGDKEASWFRSALLLPWPLSNLFKSVFRMMLKNDPTIVTSMAGTVGISSVGMFGKGHGGWGIAIGTHVLDLVVGGTARKLAEVDGRIEGFSNKSAWWAFNRLGTLTAQRWGDMRHDVDALWNPIQQELFDRQPSFEQQAVQMYKQDRGKGQAFLTSYTYHWGTVVIDKAWKLGDYLWTKYDEKF